MSPERNNRKGDWEVVWVLGVFLGRGRVSFHCFILFVRWLSTRGLGSSYKIFCLRKPANPVVHILRLQIFFVDLMKEEIETKAF